MPLSGVFHEVLQHLGRFGAGRGASGDELAAVIASFSPDETMSRAMLATVLYRLEGQPEQAVMSAYSDVSDGAWYADLGLPT